MAKVEKDPIREERISMEAIVDCYESEERAMGWYYYIADQLVTPFTATCIRKRRISPLKEGQTVKVTGMAPAEECEREMFVDIDWDGEPLAVPLHQLNPDEDDTDEATQIVVGDWHYWVDIGYQF